MNGRLERELQAEAKMMARLNSLPDIFTEFYNALVADGKTYTTLNNYINHNVDFMNYVTNNRPNNKFYKNIKATKINQYIASLRRREVNGTVVRTGDDICAARWTSLRTFFQFLKDFDYIDDNPMDRTNRPKIRTEHKVTYLTKEEIDAVLNEIKTKSHESKKGRDLCLVSLALSTGLRVSAITQINIDDINFTNHTINVVEKGNKVRAISFGGNLESLLKQCIEDRDRYFAGAETDALFLSQWKRRMTTQAVRDLVAKYTTGIQGKHITPHKLRASAATNLAASGVSIQAIAKVLGHENIQTTRRYVEVLDEEAKQATNILDNLI
jgi:site-specific recombinase XerD